MSPRSAGSMTTTVRTGRQAEHAPQDRAPLGMTRAGLSVLRARNGADAVARVQDALANRQRFELVLMDIHTPA